MRLGALGAVLAAALLAAGCGASSRPPERPVRPVSGAVACPLTRADRRDVAKARRLIARMHRLEEPLTKWRRSGPPALENAVTSLLLAVGGLPPKLEGRLLDLAKAASALCGDCFDALEAAEPSPAQLVVGRKSCHAH